MFEMRYTRLMDSKTWYTSDAHVGHNQEFVYSARGFGSIETHDSFIMNHWASTVGTDDHLVIVGDLMMGPDKISRMVRLLQNMPYGRLTYFLGNHCPRLDKLQAAFLEAGLDSVTLVPFSVQETPWEVPGWSGAGSIGHLPFKGSVHAAQGGVDEREKRYPFPSDPGQSVRIHGHTHSTERFSRGVQGSLMLHVGWDAWGRFVSAEDIAGTVYSLL